MLLTLIIFNSAPLFLRRHQSPESLLSMQLGNRQCVPAKSQPVQRGGNSSSVHVCVRAHQAASISGEKQHLALWIEQFSLSPQNISRELSFCSDLWDAFWSVSVQTLFWTCGCHAECSSSAVVLTLCRPSSGHSVIKIMSIDAAHLKAFIHMFSVTVCSLKLECTWETVWLYHFLILM